MNYSNINCSLLLIATVALSGCQTTAALQEPSKVANSQTLTQGLTLITENKATTTIGSDQYILDTYVVPFEQPYYILVRKQNGDPINFTVADFLAMQYIKPRGCTEALTRQPTLDKQTIDKTAYLIGIIC